MVGYPCFYNVLDPFNKVDGEQSDENKRNADCNQAFCQGEFWFGKVISSVEVPVLIGLENLIKNAVM